MEYDWSDWYLYEHLTLVKSGKENNEIKKSAVVVQSVVQLTSTLQSPQSAHQIKSRFWPLTR